MPNDFWKDEHFAQLETLNDFSEMLPLAFAILESMSTPVMEVCGPITTGDRTIEQNVAIFKKTIARLAEEGNTVFNQMPFQETIERICEKQKIVGYPSSLLDEFYLPLFESGKINTLCFLPGWEKSKGASWEHAQGQRLNLKIVYLSDEYAN